LETKINGNYKGESEFFQKFYEQKYIPWHKKNMQLIGTEKKDIFTRVDWLADYLNEVDVINLHGRPKGQKKNWITSQSKFRPSVLEEFVYYLLKDMAIIHYLNLKFTNKDVFAGLTINPRGNIVIMKKDVDCALVKEEIVSFLAGKVLIAVPAVAIEVKTYLDKTMWGEAQFTAQLIKRGNPASSVYIVAETNQVALDELMPDTPVDEIFILRQETESGIDKRTVYCFFSEMRDALQKYKSPRSRQPPGRLLHPK
jgi:hypothetical protein